MLVHNKYKFTAVKFEVWIFSNWNST